MNAQRGATLVEILIAMIIIVVASIAALSYFSYGRGNIGKQGNRRAAQELARQRLEQLMGTDPTVIKPADDLLHSLTCPGGSPCGWQFDTGVPELFTIGSLASRPMVTTVRCIHDPDAGTPLGTCDTLALDVKVWYTADTDEDDFHRVHIRTLKTPT